ncbi:hypothetical protein GBF38_017315 [Nibea albiflora]|uniref:Uncharacterized protein n=1 Tax=Nibea albiflora TaxID=240163 RepID=A0ACB7EEX6_NIBAL|nr:hypothetical protein GBF38_017315 [Nibea albiflora]
MSHHRWVVSQLNPNHVVSEATLQEMSRAHCIPSLVSATEGPRQSGYGGMRMEGREDEGIEHGEGKMGLAVEMIEKWAQYDSARSRQLPGAKFVQK